MTFELSYSYEYRAAVQPPCQRAQLLRATGMPPSSDAALSARRELPLQESTRASPFRLWRPDTLRPYSSLMPRALWWS